MAEMSPLRRRMIEDMTVRNLSPATQRSYIHAVSKFSRHFGRSPDRLGLEDVRAFQVHLVSTGISWPSLNPLLEIQERLIKNCGEGFSFSVLWRFFDRHDMPSGGDRRSGRVEAHHDYLMGLIRRTPDISR